MIHISLGNSKIGDTPNISLPPGISCRPNAPCYDKCYARKFYRQKEAKKAWDDNYSICMNETDTYFARITEWLQKHKPAYFRWHVSGDCPNGYYMHKVFELTFWAHLYMPKVKFLMYTKQFEMLMLNGGVKAIPPNTSVMLSMWPYLDVPNIGLRRFWVQGDPRVPATASRCPGKCETCRACWTDKHTDIVVKAH